MLSNRMNFSYCVIWKFSKIQSHLLNLTSMVKFNSDDPSGPCEDWLDLMDKGGLWHVRETVHSFFVSLEQEVQVQLKSPSFVKGTGEQKEKICRNIYESDDLKL